MPPPCPQYPRLLHSSGFILHTASCRVTSCPKVAADLHCACIPGRRHGGGTCTLHVSLLQNFPRGSTQQFALLRSDATSACKGTWDMYVVFWGDISPQEQNTGSVTVEKGGGE